MSDEITIQRIKDLLRMTDNKEVKMLATIILDYIDANKKSAIGFKTENKQ